MATSRFVSLFFCTISALTFLSACGSESTATSRDKDCPPEPSSSLSAIDRMGGLDNLQKYSIWQGSLPPKSCAGSLASYIPDLPDGYGLPPSSKPPIMKEGHVYLRYVKMPISKNGEAPELPNMSLQPQFEFEIVQLSKQQASTFRKWFKENPSSYSEYLIGNRMFYATGGGVLYMQGHRLSGGITTILANNILIKFSMPKMYTDKRIAEPVAKLFHQIAIQHGQ